MKVGLSWIIISDEHVCNPVLLVKSSCSLGRQNVRYEVQIASIMDVDDVRRPDDSEVSAHWCVPVTMASQGAVVQCPYVVP